jgi:hypothetical protein
MVASTRDETHQPNKLLAFVSQGSRMNFKRFVIASTFCGQMSKKVAAF